MKENILTVGVIVALLGVGFLLFQNKDTKDSSFGSAFDAATFQSAATSGPMTVLADVQLLATSSSRTNVIICNDSAQVVYLNLNQDIAVDLNGVPTSTASVRLNANGGCYEIDELNLYQGAIRASSTNETASLLFISEYAGR